MKQKAITLHNRGMNRDLSISKAGESAAYDNHNIRILARDNNTMLSVTNERGNREISLGGSILGDLVGWNTLNEHIILFTHDKDGIDHIYRIDYDGENFRIVAGNKDNGGEVEGVALYNGNLGFSLGKPIESIVYFETRDIQKIYWLDGEHPLRFMNFMASKSELSVWSNSSNAGDYTSFDSNRPVLFTVSADIEKDNSGNNRANGVIQYLLTYYNEHGQETGIAWVSDLVYLSPMNSGGSTDSYNSNKVTIRLRNLDNRFTNFRLYSIFRSSLNGTAVAYIVGDGTTGTDAVIVDDGAHQETEDVSRLMYLGSQNLIAGTMTHKDQTLFLGDMISTGQDYGDLETIIKRDMGESSITFRLSDSSDQSGLINDIEYNDVDGTYAYHSQLSATSSEILSFKGGEKYRFALSFQTKSGSFTRAFYICDKTNGLYPVIDVNNNRIRRIVVSCSIPATVLSKAKELGLGTVRLMIAEATYADRAIKAQGIVNPTLFNVWERYNSRLYASPSWITRPRGSAFASMHFDPIVNSINSSGEIQCNYWETIEDPTPYYKLVSNRYADEFDGIPDFQKLMIVYEYRRTGSGNGEYEAMVYILKVKLTGGSVDSVTFTDDEITKISLSFLSVGGYKNGVVKSGTGYEIRAVARDIVGAKKDLTSKQDVWAKVVEFLAENNITDPSIVPDESYIVGLFDEANIKGTKRNPRFRVYGYHTGASGYKASLSAAVNDLSSGGASRWLNVSGIISEDTGDYTASYFKKHLMFVDENVITLNSPELDYEAVSFDDVTGWRFRIVGVARITGEYSDYTIDATHGKLPGDNSVNVSFSASNGKGNLDGLTSWPLWKEVGIGAKTSFSGDIRDRQPDDVEYKGGLVHYWLHMWHHNGKIDGLSSEDNDFSSLRSKTFASARFSNQTLYKNVSQFSQAYSYTMRSLRLFNYLNSQFVGINAGSDQKYYDGNPTLSLSLPGSHKYPLIFSSNDSKTEDTISAVDGNYELFINDPVTIQYRSAPHAVISLDTNITSALYTQTILPRVFSSEAITYAAGQGQESGAILPWEDFKTTNGYKSYLVNQPEFSNVFNSTYTLNSDDRYVFIGEIYCDYGNNDTRYGGTSPADIQRNRFIPAGPSYTIPAQVSSNMTVYGNQGDTYIQRWDCMKTRPYSTGGVNNVIDVTSVMIETHVNIDGRTDKLRGTRYLASVDPEQFGVINPVYTQKDNQFVQRSFDDDFNLDAYRSSITWTLDKKDSSDIDEWTHVTLANSLKLDGDKGYCQALRRLGNTIIAFQDRAISEVLFNSRTQLSTTDGVPVEIANSGKVDGKRYISNKYGCVNKWSITEGKSALYFVDNINKAFCAFDGQGIQSLSTKLGFDSWFRRFNSTTQWTPRRFDNIVSFYDRIHSDVYLISDKPDRLSDEDMPCLVYNEVLGAFTSFFDYDSVPMMANVGDRFVSFRDGKLWAQNEGLYCNFFGTQYDYWVGYRVTPDPFGDKIWTNVDYRADYFRVLDYTGKSDIPEGLLINGESYDAMEGTYQSEETFDSLRIWNEYQNTGDITLGKEYSTEDTTRRKFRVWHIAIPRAEKSDRNKWGLDRIRNPWIHLMFRKRKETDSQIGRDLMQLHDVTVRYFE